MKKCLMLMAMLWAIAAPAAPLSAAESPALRVVLLPFTNTLALMSMYQPLRLSLQQQLGRPVALFTAADFVSHFQDIRRGDFDVAITGPHFGAWAVNDGHLPVLRYRPALRPVLVVRKADGIQQIGDLRGRVVALSNRLSVSSIAGEGWLADNGLRAGSDYTVNVRPTHTTAIMAVALGEADAAITTMTPIIQAPEDVRQRIRVIESPTAVPHLFTVMNKALGEAEAARLRAALLAFEASPEGAAFMTESGYQGYVALSEADLATMRPIVSLLPDILGQMSGE